ncbi:MAG: hypothetical protein Ct9H300mP16_06080 [Pseudomonadota bacterium]|nr:MAG: hypothetical protein Ct9H300mP16_06080 [Pseudomonadota bacterium]
MLAEAIETLGFTARAYHRILRLSARSQILRVLNVQAEHIAESLIFGFSTGLRPGVDRVEKPAC